MISITDILDNPAKVRDDTGHLFIASVVHWEHCVFAIAAWEVNAPPTPRGKHKMISTTSRDNWLLHLELVTEEKENEHI